MRRRRPLWRGWQCPPPESARPSTARRRAFGGVHDPTARAAWRALQQLGSIGPACAHDLLRLGIRSVAELRGQDPIALYMRLCELTQSRQDPCVDDTLRCAIAQAERRDLPTKWRQWFHWTPLRGQPAGTWPRELRPRPRRRAR